MTVHEYGTHVPGLSHVNKGTVDGGVTVRVIFTHCVTDNTRALLVRLVGSVVHFIHREENSPLYGFQTVADVRKGTCHNNGHRVVEEVSSDFLG